MVKYYEDGIQMMTAANRDLIGTHQYKDIINTDLELLMKQRDKTIAFYRTRLMELKS